MSTEIDNRVVQMEFDNKAFERGVRETMSTLDDFKKSLSFDKVSGGTEELSKRFDALERSIDALKGPIMSLSGAFTSLWGTIKRHTLDKVAQEIENFARRAISAISFEGMSTGKTKYEEKLNSMRVIMNATKRSAADVERVLQDLATYSDLTSYSFSEMTSYVGNFTSVGIQLEDAEIAMEGIANACALAGVNTREAGRAMREFAQAMSTGKMTNVNWMTLESMQFAGADFKKVVLEAAEARGILRETSEGVYQIISGQGRGQNVTIENFREMLRYGFMSRDVMMDVLKTFGDTSDPDSIGARSFEAAKEAKTFKDAIDAIKDSVGTKWSQAWEKVFGNVDEAAEFFTELCDTVIETTDAIMGFVHELLDGWRENGGRGSMINAMRDLWRILLDIGKIGKDAIENVFGRLNSSSLVNATRAVENFARSVRVWLYTRTDDGYYRIERITQVVQGLLSVLKIGKLIISGFFRFIGRAFSAFLPEDTLDVLGDWGLSVTDFANRLEENDTIGSWFENLGNTVAPVISFIGRALIDLVTFVKDGWNRFKETEFYQRASAWLSSFLQSLPEKWENFKTWITTTYNNIKSSPIVQAISAKIKEFIDSVPEKWERIKNWFHETVDKIKSSPAYQAIKQWLTDFINTLPERWEKIKAFFVGVYNSIKNSKTWQSIKTWFSNFFASIPGTWEKIKNWFSTAWNEGGGTIGGFFRVLGSRIKEGVQKFIAGIPAWWEQTKPKLLAVWNKIAAWFSEKFSGIATFFSNLFSGTGKKVTESASELSEAGGSADDVEQEQKGGWFSGISKAISDWWENFPWRAALGVLAIVAVVWKVFGALRDVRKIIQSVNAVKTNESVTKRRWAFAAIIGTFILMITSLAGFFLILKGCDVGTIIAGVAILAAVVVGLVVAAKIIAKNELGDSLKAFGEAGMGLAAISAAIMLMIPSILAFAAMPFGTFIKGFGMVSLILAVMTGAMILITRFGGNNGPAGEHSWKSVAASIIALAVAVDILAIAVNSFAGSEDLAATAAAVGLVSVLIASIGFALWLAGRSMKTDKDGKVKTITGSILAMALVVKILVDAAKHFGKKGIGEAAVGVGSVILLIAAFAGVMAAIGDVAKGQTTRSIVSFMIMSLTLVGVVMIFTEAIKQIEDVDWKVIAAFGGSLVGLLLGISLLGAVSKVMTVRSALVILAVFAAVAAGLILIGAAVTVILALGATVMSTFCSSISLLGTTLKLFDSNTSGIERSRMDDIFAIIREFATIMVGFINVDFGAVDNFSVQTYRIGIALNAYNREVSSINYTSLDRSIEFITTIGSVSNDLSRIRNLDKIPRVILSMGSAIKLYYRSLKGINTDDIANGESVDMGAIGVMIQRLAASLPKDSDIEIISAYTDNGSLAQLALDIVSLGDAIASLSDSTTGSDRDSVDYAVDILNQISSLATAMPADDEIETAFGTLHRHYYSLSSFALDIEALARGLTALSTCFGDEEGKANVGDAIAAIREIAEIRTEVVGSSLGDNLTALGDWLHGIAANSAWDNFVTSIGTLGSNVATMANELEQSSFDDVGDTEIDRLVRCVGAIADIYGALAEASGVNTSALGITALLKAAAETTVWNNFVSSFPQLASGISTLATEFSDPKYSNLNEDGLNNVERMITAIAGLYGSASLASLFTDFGGQIADISGGIAIMATTVNSEEVSSLNDKDIGKIGHLLTMIANLFRSVRNEEVSSDGINSIFLAIGGNSRWVNYVSSFPAVAGGIIVLATSMNDKNVANVSKDSITKVSMMLGAITDVYNTVTSPLTGSGQGLNSLFAAMAANNAWAGYVKSFPAVAYGISAISKEVTTSRFPDVTDDDIGKIGSMLETIAGVYNSVTDPFTGDGQALDALFASIAANNAWTGFVGSFESVANGVKEISEVLTGETFSNVVDYDITRLRTMLEAIAGVYSSVTTPITSSNGIGLDSLFRAMAANSAWTGFVDEFGSIAGGVTKLADVATSDEVREVTREDISTVTSILDMIASVYGTVTSPITRSQQSGLTNLLTAVGANSSWDNFVGSFPDIAKNTDDFVTTIRGLNLSGADDDSIRIVSSILTMIASVYGAVYSAKAKYVHEHNAQNAWDIIGGIIAPWTWIDNSHDATGNGDWHSFVASLSTLGRRMGEFITALRESGINDLDANIVVTFFGAIGDLFESLMVGAGYLSNSESWTQTQSNMAAAIRGLVNGLDDGIADELGAAIAGLFGGFANAIQNGIDLGDGNRIDFAEVMATYEEYKELFDFFTSMMSFIGSFASSGVNNTNYLRSINNLNTLLGGTITDYRSYDARQTTVTGLIPEILRGLAQMTRDFSASDFDSSVLVSAGEMLDEFVSLAATSVSAAGTDADGIENNDILTMLRALGGDIDEQIASGMDSNLSSAFDTALESLVNYVTSVAPAISNLQSRAIDIGRNIDLGVGSGVARWKRVPLNELTMLIVDMVNRANTLLDIHSPSRVFTQTGRYIDQGFANGIRKDSKDPKNEMANMVDALFNVTAWVAPSLADGVLSEAERFTNAMTVLGETGVEALRDTLDIHSLSPMLRDSVGAFIPISIAAGVDAKSPIYTTAMRQLALDGTQHFVMAAEFDTTGYIRNFARNLTGNATRLLSGSDWNSMFASSGSGSRHFSFRIVDTPRTETPTVSGGSGGSPTSGTTVPEIVVEDGVITVGGETFNGTDILGSLGELQTAFEGTNLSAFGLSDEADLTDLLGAIEGVTLPEGFNINNADQVAQVFSENAGPILSALGFEGVEGMSTIEQIRTLFGFLGSSHTGGTWNVGNIVSGIMSRLGYANPDEVEDAVSEVVEGTTGGTTGSTGGGTGGRGGGSGGNSYGNNEATITPGGLILNPTDGYTIGDILTRIDRLENAITQMVIVLDTGVVAGQMAPAIDSTLGGYIQLNGRWN